MVLDEIRARSTVALLPLEDTVACVGEIAPIGCFDRMWDDVEIVSILVMCLGVAPTFMPYIFMRVYVCVGPTRQL